MEPHADPTEAPNPTNLTDPVAERAALVFRAGFLVSAAFLLSGIALIAIRSQSLPSHLVPLADLPTSMAHGSSASFVTLGILAMLLTPMVSTLTIGWTFFQEGDKRYGRLAGLVLLILIVSILLSLR